MFAHTVKRALLNETIVRYQAYYAIVALKPITGPPKELDVGIIEFVPERRG